MIVPFDFTNTAHLIHDFLYDHRGDPPPCCLPARPPVRRVGVEQFIELEPLNFPSDPGSPKWVMKIQDLALDIHQLEP